VCFLQESLVRHEKGALLQWEEGIPPGNCSETKHTLKLKETSLKSASRKMVKCSSLSETHQAGD
jgi:hypothetical protein